MVAPPRPVAPAGLGAVGTPRNGRGVGTMETMMTKKIGQPKQSGNARAAKPKTAAPRGRQRPQTKKQIAVSLLQRSKGASIAEMQRAMGWQEHSVRGFLAATVKKMQGVTLISEKLDAGPRRYRVVRAEG